MTDPDTPDTRCARCDRPRIPDRVWAAVWRNAPGNVTVRALIDGVAAAWPGYCDARYDHSCSGDRVDWRARALTAETRLAEVDWQKIYREAGALRDRVAVLESLLEDLDKQGGLGLDVHARIRAALMKECPP